MKENMEINVFNQYGSIGFDFESVIADISACFPKDASASLILVNLKDIQKINHSYRHLDQPTDVISFENDDEAEEEDGYMGDIFICVDKVKEQAEAYGHSLLREFAFLLVHGLLHLSGYDHQNEEQETEMLAKQEEILNKTNYRREKNE